MPTEPRPVTPPEARSSPEREQIEPCWGQCGIAALRAQVQALTAQLAECYRLSGADPDDNEDWRLAPKAVNEVKRLRQESDAEIARLTEENERLKATMRDGYFHEQARAEVAESRLREVEEDRDEWHTLYEDEQVRAEAAEARFTTLAEAVRAVEMEMVRLSKGLAAGRYWAVTERDLLKWADTLRAALIPPGCTYQGHMSRICERGTSGCTVRHGAALPKED